jgi:hypothetical protein
MKPAIVEKRGLERFDLEIPARIKVAVSHKDEEIIDLLTSDISSGGAFFHTTQPLAEGTDVKIDLILPIAKLCKTLNQGEGEYAHAYIKVSGKVLRKEAIGMAIVFNEDYEISPWHGDKTVEH